MTSLLIIIEKIVYDIYRHIWKYYYNVTRKCSNRTYICSMTDPIKILLLMFLIENYNKLKLFYLSMSQISLNYLASYCNIIITTPFVCVHMIIATYK